MADPSTLEGRALARKVLETEAAAIRALIDRLDERFDCAVSLLRQCRGRVILTGMGKSGIICRKIAATLTSTGTAAFFMHPAEARHGDLGVVQSDDVVVARSAPSVNRAASEKRTACLASSSSATASTVRVVLASASRSRVVSTRSPPSASRARASERSLRPHIVTSIPRAAAAEARPQAIVPVPAIASRSSAESGSASRVSPG